MRLSAHPLPVADPRLLAFAAEQLGLPVAKVVQVVRACREVRSLDIPLASEGQNAKGDAEHEALVDTLEDHSQEYQHDESSEDR